MIAGIGGLALRVLTTRYEGSVTKERLLDPSARQESNGRRIEGPLNYLLVGSDQRAKKPEDGRADTIMIVHISPDLDRGYFISVPRDLLVQIPAHPSTGFGGGPDKVNAAFRHGNGGEGGSQLLSATLTQLTGIRFDGAAIINFAGFEKVIDRVGGVELCLDKEVRSMHTGHVFQPGCQQLNGGQALDLARQRYDLPEGDFDRQRHQQQLLRALAEKIADLNLLAEPIKADQIIREIGAALTVDTNGTDTEDLVVALRDLRPERLTGIRLPARPETINGTSYVLLENAAVELFRSVRDGDVDDWVKTHREWINKL